MDSRPQVHRFHRPRFRGLNLAVAAWLATAGALAAQPAASAPASAEPVAGAEPAQSLAELERRALAASPGLGALRERLAAAEARASAAGVLADPMLELEVMDALPTGGRPFELRPTLRQPLPAAGKRGAARAVAAAEVEVARAELALAGRRLVTELRRAWAEHWIAERERLLLEDAHGAMELLVTSADARLAGGGGSVAEALEARRMVRRHELEQENADARFLAAISRLAELVGEEPPAPIPHGVDLSDATPPDLDIAATVAGDPRLAVAVARWTLAEQRLAATRLERRSDWSVAAGTRTMEGDTTELVVGVGVELPLFRRRRVEPAIAAAERDVAAAVAEAEAQRRASRGELERLYAERFRLEARARRLEQGLLPELEAALANESAALVAGDGSIAGAARLLEESIATRLERERVRAALFAVRADFLSYLPADPDGGAE